MKLLLDTNIFLEVMLSQSKAADARKLLSQTGKHELHLTDFSPHSIGCYLFNRKKHPAFKLFFRDMIVIAGVRVISLAEHHYDSVGDAATRFNLDFDDAYQYAVAKTHGLGLVSFDSDFDRTDLRRKTPAEILKSS